MTAYLSYTLALPEVLMPCPACRGGMLAWTRRAYCCTSRWRDVVTGERCQYGITLGALFVTERLDYDLWRGRRVEQLGLTRLAVMLLYRGEIVFAWLPAATIDGLYRDLSRSEQAGGRQDRDELDGIERRTVRLLEAHPIRDIARDAA